jgi:uncharacterized protein (TIGR03084 family)
MSVLDELLADLTTEGDRLRAVVAGLEEAGWRTPTPAAGWDVATQIAHLAWTDEMAVLATSAAAGDTGDWDAAVLEAIGDPEGYVDAQAVAGGLASPSELLARWDASRSRLPEALRASAGKMPWFGPPMSPTSMATARLMETWAHALDVYEALGVEPAPTDAVRHVCHLGVRTRDFSFATQGRPAPVGDFHVSLVLPSGEVAVWGPDDAPQTVTGSAWDFACLVTQRVHRADTDLVTSGTDAEEWLTIAQAFAGPPGAGRDPR